MTLETTDMGNGYGVVAVVDDGMTITDLVKPGRQVYDGKTLWEKYCDMGRAATYDKLARWATSIGMKKPSSERATRMGVFFSMWRYALRNPEKAYPAYEKWAKAYESELIAEGVEVTFEMLLKDIKKHAKTPGCVGKASYIKFCERYGLESEWED